MVGRAISEMWWRVIAVIGKVLSRFKLKLKEPRTKAEAIEWLIRDNPDGRTVDMRLRGWGCNMEKIGDSWAVWSTPRLCKGDFILTENGKFIVFEVRPCYDPPDMVFASFWKVEDNHEEN